MDINININNNEKEEKKFNPKSVLSQEFKKDVEDKTEEINNMIDEIDKYYNIRADKELSNIIRTMMESRIKFLDAYERFSSWYKKHR
jgi:hypothetical protein